MSAKSSPQYADGTRVELAELIALRQQVVRALAMRPVAARLSRAGAHASPLRGRGMDYAESRAYQPGDDVRQVDWRLTARSGRLHTKLFQEERERSLLLIVDTHRGMRFGTRRRFKSVQAARAAALATWMAQRHSERVGVVAFGGCRHQQRPHGGTRGALAVLGALSAWDDAPGTGEDEPLSEALRRCARLLRGASQVIVISDGQSCDEKARAQLLQIRRRADIGVLVVADALEQALPPPGRYPLAHDGEHRIVDLFGDVARHSFLDTLGAGQARLMDMCRELGLRHRRIDTAADPLPAITALRGRGGAGP